MKYCIDCKHCEETVTLPTPFRICHKYSGSLVIEDPVVGKRVEHRLAFCAIERDDAKGHCGREARGFEPKPPPRKPWWRRLWESQFGKGEWE